MSYPQQKYPQYSPPKLVVLTPPQQLHLTPDPRLQHQQPPQQQPPQQQLHQPQMQWIYAWKMTVLKQTNTPTEVLRLALYPHLPLSCPAQLPAWPTPPANIGTWFWPVTTACCGIPLPLQSPPPECGLDLRRVTQQGHHYVNLRDVALAEEWWRWWRSRRRS